MEIKETELTKLKLAYKQLYLKSRELKTSKEQQDEVLDRLVSDLLVEQLVKFKSETDKDFNNEGDIIVQRIKELVKEWKSELEDNTSVKKWWQIRK